jgi:hypothetical protein
MGHKSMDEQPKRYQNAKTKQQCNVISALDILSEKEIE